jgi:type VI secretion system protein ImpL
MAMKQKQKAWMFAGAVLLLFQALGVLLPMFLNSGSSLRIWVLRGGLWLLGVIAAALVYLVVRNREEPVPANAQNRDEIDVAIAAARARLAAAKGKAASQFGRLPLLLIAGPSAAAKTSIVTRSGLQPDLLAGEVMRGDAVAPTTGINVWYAHEHLVVEAGGRVASDQAQWRKLIRYIQPRRLGAVLSRGRQAPRVAVVCLGCDELLKPGASEAVPAQAQKLRTRLAEVSHEIGIRLPVYVLFTKADRLPYFEDFVRSFTREEARDVLGATLTVPPLGNVGHYAERESRRIAYAFQGLFHGLALRRIEVLPRENQEIVKSGTYEFPREFRKITDLASLFLLELCRPSQLGVSPFLRGFYFTGVRPVLVHDVAAPAPAVQARVPAGGAAVDATSVFDPRALYQSSAPPPVAQTGARKVPEWVFLDRVFRDVILRDAVAQSVTAGGTKVTLGRRLLLSAATAAVLFFCLGMIWSLFANGRLLRDTRSAVEGARSLALGSAVPDADALQRLDALRVQAEKLNRYERDDNPLGTSWMLYAGDRVQQDVHTLYFRKFEELLWAPTRARLHGWLGALPATPNETSNYDATFDALKAYLVTSERPDSARRAFLAPTLMRYWLMNGEIDVLRRQLAEQQFGFFADELPHDDPFDQQVNANLVTHSRAFLHAFSNEQQLYSYLLTIARESVSPIRWQDANVHNDFVVRPEFTRPGWQRAQEALKDVPRLLNRETWVVGESAVPETDRVRIEGELRRRYAQDYSLAWTTYLQSGRVPGVSGIREAAARLRNLANSPSPLIRMIGVASEHTTMDTAIVGKTFAPSLAVAANSTTSGEAGGKYLQAISGLQTQLDQVVNATGSMRDQAQMQALDGARLARNVVNEMLLGFNPQGQAQAVSSAIGQLLHAPIVMAENALGRVSIEALNGNGPVFCRPFELLGRKYPFDRNGREEAAPSEVKDLLGPGTGTLWAFYQDNLQNLVSRSGSRFGPRQGVSPEVSPQFLNYFNTLASISDALFDDNGNYELLFTMRMEASAAAPLITFNMGSSATFSATSANSRPVQWDAAPLSARISAGPDARQQQVYGEAPAGPWSLFRLLAMAQVEPRGSDTYRVTWRGPTGSISGELKLNEASSIFHPGQLSRVGSCPRIIAR